MGGVAQIAKAAGHEVEGTDDNFYEPMAGLLAKASIKCHQGYDTDAQKRRADLYIIGNVIRRGNSFFESICAKGKAFCSGPEWVAKEFLARNKKVIAIAGTHGKTTTSAMAAHILETAGLDPGYLVGGVLSCGNSARLGSGKVAVIEADEYDTAFFDKRPKFTHYWSDVLVLNNIEFDHADIYPDMDSILRQFALAPRNVFPKGAVVANWRDANVKKVVAENSWYRIVRTNNAKGWSLKQGSIEGFGKRLKMTSSLPAGKHIGDNFLSAMAACEKVGVKPSISVCAMSGFRLPMRRMQEIIDINGIALVDDFAHHPTSIALTIKAARASYKKRRVVVLFEPRSNTMRLGYWQGKIAGCLHKADAVLALSHGIKWDLAEELQKLGTRARTFSSVKSLEKAALREAKKDETCLLMLSNGDFHGLRKSLSARLSAMGAG